METKQLIEDAFQNPSLTAEDFSEELVSAIEATIKSLDEGELTVAAKKDTGWVVNDYAKMAILLYFRMKKMEIMESGPFTYYDKIPLKKWTGSEGVRVVPQALVRRGAFVEKGAILMPSYTNIGAFVGSGSMVDIWATVGSCAYIGKNVHLSGGVGIGGVLEPVQAAPVIIEDNAFIGSRCIVVEGVHVEEGAVLGAGVTITQSTKIIDVTQKEPVTYQGRVPKNSVVIPGTQLKNFEAGQYGVPAALIIGQRKESTDRKTSLTNALRDFNVSV